MTQQREYEDVPVHRRRSGGGGMGVMAILISLLFIVGPIVAPIAIPALSQVILVGFGVGLLLIGSIIVTITRLYRKTSADEAFVRTGMGGSKAIIDGGAIVIPVVHEVVPVSLKTMKLIVERHLANALITGDNLRADVTAEFFIRVQKDKDAVLAAATSLGEKAMNPKAVQDTVFEKLVNALRTVGATKELQDLHTKRDEFAAAVQQIVAADLKHNGLTLESVTISKLDQTPVAELKDDNVFDAQGARRIAQITQAAKVEKNRFIRDAEQAVAVQDTTTAKLVFAQEVAKAAAEADKGKDIAIAQATATQQAESQAAEQHRLAGVAKAASDQAVKLAEVERDRAVAVAGAERQGAELAAKAGADKVSEVAAKEKEIVVAAKATELAAAQKVQQEATAEAVAAEQHVETVKVRAVAEREKAKAVIAKTAEAEQDKVKKNTDTDITAYATVAQARAEKESADNKADAKITLARAEKDAAMLTAEGDKAVQMVPVDVRERQVAVERQALANENEFQAIARELKVKLAEIEATREVQMAIAGAMGTALSQAKITLWGTPGQAAQMTEMFLKGQRVNNLVAGLLTGASGDPSSLANMATLLTGALERLTGVRIPADKVGEAISAVRDGARGEVPSAA